MDWSRCDEIEYDCQYENNNIVQTGKKLQFSLIGIAKHRLSNIFNPLKAGEFI